MTTRANSRFPRPDSHRLDTPHYGLRTDGTESTDGDGARNRLSYSRRLGGLDEARVTGIRVAGGRAGGAPPVPRASARGLPFGQPHPPRRSNTGNYRKTSPDSL